ncbi:MAG: hypothetical protein NWE96_02000 [Candidatus Bathyarchaeota archaeon]|nr:hypothetical protein [Candidatus Bathyarchaeota archaeon]
MYSCREKLRCHIQTESHTQAEPKKQPQPNAFLWHPKTATIT